MRRIVLIGYPGSIGGASTEAWHTIKLWRSHGQEVVCIPTWEANEYRTKLDAIGVRTIEATEGTISSVPELQDSIVVSFCNVEFLVNAAKIEAAGPRAIVWLGCMNWGFSAWRMHARKRDLGWWHVFQSEWQRDHLTPQLDKYHQNRARTALIPGAMDAGDFPCSPLAHRPGEIFTVGRAARATNSKWSASIWHDLEKVPHPILAKFLGWDDKLRAARPNPPDWCELHEPGSIPIGDYLPTLHCGLSCNHDAVENWPRWGLECMAAGVPIVAENAGGWPEMVENGRSGLLYDNPLEMAYQIARLAYDEDLRQSIISEARFRLTQHIAEPERIWGLWRDLFERIEHDD
jgi:hypothetical protein